MEPHKFAETVGKLQTQYVETVMHGWDQYVDLVGSMARAPGDPAAQAEFQQRYLRFTQREMPETVAKLTETGMQYYAAVLEASADLSRQFMESFRTAPSPQKAGPAGRESGMQDLQFLGFVGEKPVQSFIVANKTGNPLAVGFELSEFLPEEGDQKVKASIHISPDSFELAPKAERVVECRLPITSDFVPGRTYRGLLRVTGFPNMTVGLCVRSQGPLPEAKKEAKPEVKKEQPVSAKSKRKTTRPRKARKARAARKTRRP